MKKVLELGDVLVSYELIVSKSRKLRIKVDPTGVYLYKPFFMPDFLALKFLKSRREWLLRVLAKQEKFFSKLTPIEKENYLQNYKKSKTKSGKRELEGDYIKRKKDARILVEELLQYWRKIYKEKFDINFNWNKVSIKKTSTRWGSCSSKKNLNFSYKILDLDKNQRNYLIVHELSHLHEMNHGENFWKLVELGSPDFKTVRKTMKFGLL